MELSIFLVSSAIILLGGLGVLTSRNPVHAALSLVGTFFGVAVLFLNQNAQLLAAVQVIVYTGAIVVLILFVLMLIGVDKDEDIETEPLIGQRTLAGIIGVAFLGCLLTVFIYAQDSLVTGKPNCVEPAPIIVGSPFTSSCTPLDPSKAVPDAELNVSQVGRVLFSDHIFVFEITALILTIAVIGAIFLARKPKSYEALPELDPLPIHRQVLDEREANFSSEEDEGMEHAEKGEER